MITRPAGAEVGRALSKECPLILIDQIEIPKMDSFRAGINKEA